MSRRQTACWALGAILVTAAGVGSGTRNTQGTGPEKESPEEIASGGSPQVAQLPPGEKGTSEAARGTSGKAPVAGAGAFRKRALLVGVTKYYNVRQADLSGPANDVRLMRELLEKSYQFPPDAIVTLAESEGRLDRRPTRENIEREFHNLAETAREGDQIVILLCGHGARQPADPGNHEPDGINEIFLPADVSKWNGFPDKVPKAIEDKELANWLEAITTKKAHVWILFDCCHSGTMARGSEVVRELPPGLLVPEEELKKARDTATKRNKTRGGPGERTAAFVPREPSDYLVAVYACREHEQEPESPQPPDGSPEQYYGLLTYSVVEILTKSAASKTPLTYRELVQRIQVRYAARPQGYPTPLVEGKGQGRVVLGTNQPIRPSWLLSKRNDKYRVNAGNLHGLTNGSILAVYSPLGTEVDTKLLGHVRVTSAEPFESRVEPCAYQNSPLVTDLPPLSTCQPVAIDYGLRRFKVAIQVPAAQVATRQQISKALAPLASEKDGLVTIVEDPRQAEWLIRLEKGNLQLIEASGNRAPFALPGPQSSDLAEALRHNLEKVYRASNLIGISGRFEEQRYRGALGVNVEVEVLRHKDEKAPGEVLPRPVDGWRFRPGDFVSFRLKNRSDSPTVDVTLLIVGSDFQIHPFYPKQGELAKSLKPGDSIDTPPPPGRISDEPPFGPECLIVIAVPARNPPANFTALAQDGLTRARSADESKSLQSPLGELLESAMFRSGARGPLTPSVTEKHGMRVLTWTTEPARPKAP